jgi:hypothetical protein
VRRLLNLTFARVHYFLRVKVFFSLKHFGDLLKLGFQFGLPFGRLKVHWVWQFRRQLAIMLDLVSNRLRPLELFLPIAEPILSRRPIFDHVMGFRSEQSTVGLVLPQIFAKDRVQLVLKFMAQEYFLFAEL